MKKESSKSKRVHLMNRRIYNSRQPARRIESMGTENPKEKLGKDKVAN
jgi:hypothetical protein